MHSGITTTLGFSLLLGPAAVLAQSPEQIEFFETKIRPVLVEHCYKCHSAEAKGKGKLKGGLLLDTREGIRKGGDTGPAVVPGNTEGSLLLTALRHEDDLEMPKDQLPPEVIADFAKWIQMGAADPRDGQAIAQTTIDITAGRNFWSFQPLTPVAGSVDELIEAKLREKGLTPVPAAGPETLVRRLYFDLIGLPPGPDDLEAWSSRLRADSTDAFAKLVDSLLASPQFGVRWGRHWLDVARYAESNGNTRNATFPHAWRYRDYVIDAFNTDTPYDQFIRQQIAGDLLPADTHAVKNRNLVATGFLALASKPVIRGKGNTSFIPDLADDQINVISKGVLGLTVSCARCHDHKFDPIPTTDYYGLAGIFASSETLYGGGGNNMGGAPVTELHQLAGDPGQRVAYDEWKSKLDELKKENTRLAQQLKKLRPKRGKEKGKGNRKGEATPKSSDEAKAEIAALDERRREISAEMKKLSKNPPAQPNAAMGMRERGKVTEVPIYVRGESPKGEAIPRRFLTVLTDDAQPEFPSDQSGRLEFAQWLTSRDNPLTARVMVNRIWHHLFGAGIVRTPGNFGMNGERPTNPELLDFLAAEFMEDGWSVKRMIRRLVLTDAYRRSDAHHAGNYQIDPENDFAWRNTRKRLESEVIRDSILAVSGRLELERPEVGSVVTAVGGQLIQDGLTPDKIHQPSNHRSVYLAMLRNGLPETLEVFDQADPSLVVGKRSVTTVPSQDLFLMNNPFVLENAEAFAERILELSESDAARIDAAYRRALSRPATEIEKQRATYFIEEARKALEATDHDPNLLAWAGFCQALMVSAEFRHLH